MKSTETSFPFRTILLTQFVASVAAAALWFIGALGGGFGMEIVIVGVSEASLLFVVSIGALALYSPGKKRPIATAATLWSVTSFGRFLAALGGSYVLHYVAHFGLRPLMYSFLLTAVFLLIAETKVIALRLSKTSKTTE